MFPPDRVGLGREPLLVGLKRKPKGRPSCLVVLLGFAGLQFKWADVFVFLFFGGVV